MKEDSSHKKLKAGEDTIEVGSGGEPRQTTTEESSKMTTELGIPLADDASSLKAGSRGPVLMQDFTTRSKLFHFDHERIPERVVHARGTGAHGYFENYKNQSDLTCADLFQRPGEKTPAFVRFSTVAGSKGSADLARDVRGFAVKLYTKEGNWDIVGNNIPVFFIQDAVKFPDLIHAAKPEPDCEMPQAATAHDNFWDFVSLSPESMHMLTWIMSTRAIPRSLRTMEGFGVHTFRLVNKEGKATFVKFHWKPKAGVQSVVWPEAVKLNGADADFHRRDLWEAIGKGDFPEWELCFQLISEEQLKKFPFDILDATKLLPEEDFPLTAVGRLVLNRRVDNFFAETEQVAFCTSNVVPGIDFTADPLLQGRNFSYLDTQLKRLGSTNFTYIPINAPRCPFANFQRDGHMTVTVPKGRANYNPNSWPLSKDNPRVKKAAGYKDYAVPLEGSVTRERSATFADHYSQARQFYISQTKVEQKQMADAFVFELSKVKTMKIRVRLVSHLLNIDEGLAKAVADGLGFKELPKAAEVMRPIVKLEPRDSLSIIKGQLKTLKGRKIGCLISQGVDAELLDALKKEAKDRGATLELVAPRVEGMKSSAGKSLEIDHNTVAGTSALFDVAVILLSDEQVKQVCRDANARDFVGDAFHHLKYIAFNKLGKQLVDKSGIEADEAVVAVDSADQISKFLDTVAKNMRQYERLFKLDPYA